MRCGIVIVSIVLLCGGVVAEDSTGLSNPSNSVGGDKPNGAAAASTPVPAAGRPIRPLAMLTRPRDSVRHPNLDRAWGDHDAVVARVTESIRAAIDKQFDAATDKADLDAAEKWGVVLKCFDERGELPNEKEIEVAVNAASDEYWEAKDELSKAYDAVIKDLTKQQQIATAVLAREELREQQSRNCDPVTLRNLYKELEAIGDRDGWYWQHGDYRPQDAASYSLDKIARELTYRVKHGDEMRVHTELSPKYEVIGVDVGHERIALIEMIYPPKQGKPGVQQIWRFDRTTGVMDTGYGWLAVPKHRIQ